ncbi:MAG: ABC transporter substrate-binding protein [Geminicoccaceae bacterium]|nr:ABC transporter substrate-binding protein [Geminicoccaceae bacterium]MCB9944694.1 ABC transporter substrate-binding protein [Geminicoccaceae bacterium]
MLRHSVFVAVVGASVLGLSIGTDSPVQAADDSLTVVSWGGAYTKSQIEAYHKPFTEKTGIAVNSVDYNGGLAEVRAQSEAGNVTWDMVDVELSDAVRGCDEGLFAQIDPAVLPPGDDGTPAEEDFIDGAVNDCAIGTIVWSTVYAYRTDQVGSDAPSTIADFFDLEKFPGKRGLRRSPKVNLEFALMADGVPADQVYDVLSTPEGVDRAFAKLDSIKPEVIWWEAGAQPPQLLADGEVVMTSAYNGRLYSAIVNEGQPMQIVWDGQVWDFDLWAILEDAPHKQTALDFLVFSTDTERLARQADWISYGPVRRSSMVDVKPDVLPHLPTAPENFTNALQNNFEFWADNQDELNERFNTWIAN